MALFVAGWHVHRLGTTVVRAVRLTERFAGEIAAHLGLHAASKKLCVLALRSRFARRIVASLPFETRRLPNHPLIKAMIGSIKALASLDTGMNGALEVTDDLKARLIGERLLTPAGQPDAYDLVGIRLAGVLDLRVNSIEIERDPSPSAKPIGVTEETELQLDYAFLRQYKTVWDFRRKQLLVLPPDRHYSLNEAFGRVA